MESKRNKTKQTIFNIYEKLIIMVFASKYKRIEWLPGVGKTLAIGKPTEAYRSRRGNKSSDLSKM